jgi:type VI secretion system protein ImpJ
MTQMSKIIWSEGMHLAPHHFQVQSRYFEESIQFALASLFFKPYGLAACELDADALRNGIVSLIHARGVMPDGLAFNFPGGDPLPPPRQIGELFSPVQESHLVHLAIPPYRPGASNCAPAGANGGARVRYFSESRSVSDETTGVDERPVTIARRNFRLALDLELAEDVELPLGRIRRDGAGHFVYDPVFIPPCLQIGGSERLIQSLQRLVEILDAKSDALASERSGGSGVTAEYGGRGVAGFWLLHAIRSSLGPLRYHLQTRRSHPEQLYLELARLAGALCTFSLDADPRAMPLYDHDRPEDSFTGLDRQIRSYVELAIPATSVSIPLKPASAMQYLHAGQVSDRRCFGRARWILGVRSSLNDTETVARVPRVVKVCASRHVPELVKRAYPGLGLEHTPVPPAAISPRPGTHYFSISTVGTCWGEIIRTGEVGVYVPDSLPDAQLELLALLAPDQES